MNERVVAFRVGIVVLAAAFVTGFLIILLGEGRSVWQGRYTIYLRFSQTPGVTMDTPVRKNGVLIGRITQVDLRDEGGVMLTARIDSGRKLLRNEIPRISSSSLLGDAVVEFVPSEDPSKPRTQVADGDVIAEGLVASDPVRVLTNLEGDVRRVMKSVETAANNFSDMSTRLNTTLGANEDQIPRLLQKTELAMDKFRDSMVTIDQLIGDEELRNKLKQGLNDLPVTLEEMRLTMGKARDSLDSFQGLQEKAGRNLENLERFTKPLGDRGDELVKNVNSILVNVDEMTAEVADLARRIKSSDGSLAKFIRDDELYRKVNEMVDNLHDASRRIRPIMDDVRVFTDKIATDPRQLGLKGMVDKKPLGVGVKGTMPQLRGSWSPAQEEE